MNALVAKQGPLPHGFQYHMGSTLWDPLPHGYMIGANALVAEQGPLPHGFHYQMGSITNGFNFPGHLIDELQTIHKPFFPCLLGVPQPDGLHFHTGSITRWASLPDGLHYHMGSITRWAPLQHGLSRF